MKPHLNLYRMTQASKVLGKGVGEGVARFCILDCFIIRGAITSSVASNNRGHRHSKAEAGLANHDEPVVSLGVLLHT